MNEAEKLEAAMSLVEANGFVIIATAAYKSKAIAEGFTEHAAEHMALRFHAQLVDAINKNGETS